MNIDGKAWRTIWLEPDGRSVGVIDQTRLPHQFTTRTLRSCEEAAEAIRTMVVRGAPLIGVTGAYGLVLALQADDSDASLAASFELLNATRPTAINLRWALERVRAKVQPLPPAERAEAAKAEAVAIADEDVAMCEAIARCRIGSATGRSERLEEGAGVLAAPSPRTRWATCAPPGMIRGRSGPFLQP